MYSIVKVCIAEGGRMGIRIISQRSDSRGREIKQYLLDGIQTIGVCGDESYSIEVRNPFPEKVLVMIAVDGTNVLTGKKAVLDPNSKHVFVLNSGGVMQLKAWPETSEGGGRLVFTDVGNSVALHTHGDLTAKGYISVAVFREGYVAPPIYTGGHPRDRYGLGPLVKSSGGPATGVGERVAQHIGTAVGLIQPEFQGEIWQVRYLWWDELKARLAAAGITPSAPSHPTGFEPSKLADLGTTPRIGAHVGPRMRKSVFAPVSPSEYQRLM